MSNSHRRESLLKQWESIEQNIAALSDHDYNLHWGSLRERFYKENGAIPCSSADMERLSMLKDAFKGERIFILGNGPSLNQTPLELLQDEFAFVTNRIYLLFDRIDWRPAFYTATDWRVVPDIAHEINLLTGMIFFFEERFRGLLRSDDEDIYWYTHTGAAASDERRFAYDITNGVRGAGSVTGSAIQIAFYMGFSPIYLIGCDLGYKVGDTVKQEGADKFGTGTKLYLTSTEDDDYSHFDKRYFGKGRRWHDPHVERMIEGHMQCREGIERAGGKIFNATVGGELEVYERIDFRSLFPRPKQMAGKRLLQKIRKPMEAVSRIPEPCIESCLLGPFVRCEHASMDETQIAFHLLMSAEAGVMVDVGAHHGSSLLPFAKNGWRIYAFEPDSDNRRALVKRVAAFRNVSVDKRAISDTTERAIPFYSSSESSGISSLTRFSNSHVQSGTVDTVTLTHFCSERKISRIDFLKIDAEGYDLLILKGVPWDSIRPNLIMCEFEDRKTRSLGYTMHDMAHYLIERGYSVLVSEWHPIIRYGVKHAWHRLAPYPCELNHPDAWGNLIAFREQPNLQTIATIARNTVKVNGEAPKRGGRRVTSLTRRPVYRRLVGYLKIHYPTIITVGRFGMWGLAKLKKTLRGAGGVALLVIVGLYVAGALGGPLRWYLVGIATALLLLGGGLLALSYARFILNRFVSDQRPSMRDRTAQLQAVLDGLKKEISDNKDTLLEMQDTLAKMNVGNFALFQPFNRRLTDQDLKRFAVEWAPKLGLRLNPRALPYMAHRICLAEDTCIGRLAGNIETMLLRALVARSVKEQNLEVLEIGTLFGIGVAMIHENCRGFFNSVHLTIIDPLSGYYGKNELDVLTGIPVTRDLFVHNMQRMNIPESDYTIIEKLSTEDEAIEEASKKRYNLLIIDGDHSGFGVKHDFSNYRHLVKRGGYIIFDDYGNPHWPEIKAFVDKEVVGLLELEFVGTDVHTAVFRVIAPEDSTRQAATTVATITAKDKISVGAPLPALAGRGTTPDPSFDYPEYVFLETVATCNARCDFCPQSKLARRGHIMPMGLIERAISELSEMPPGRLPEIGLNGVNEPLTDKRIFDILDLVSCRLPGASIYFVTNASLLSEQAIGELSRHSLSRLCISLNFCDKESYEQRMGLRWDKTLAAMSILHEKVTSGEFRHPVRVSRVQDESAYDASFASWVEGNYPGFGCGLKRSGDWLGLVPDLSHRPREVSNNCPEWHRMHIAATGVVRRCCMDADAEHPWGDVTATSLLEIFNQDEWRALRRGQRNRSEVHPCNKCTYY